MSRQTATLLVLVAATGFGAMAMFAKFAYAAGITPAMLLAVRFVLATALLAPVVWWKGLRLPRGRVLAGFVLMGALYTAQSLSYFNGLLHASSGLIALLLYAYPALVTLFEVLLGWERFDRRTGMLLALAIVGMIVTLGGDLQGDRLGIALGLACAFIYSSYLILGGRLTRSTTQAVDPLASTLVILASAAVGNVALALNSQSPLPQTPGAWLAIAAIALFSTVIAIACSLIGVKVIGAPKASILSTLEPVITILLGAMVFGEVVGTGQLIGGAMVLTAVVMLAQKPHPVVDGAKAVAAVQ
ncbi:DMT family transporter [Oxalobacteraceae bacterium OM1]|nr:DMT family transporter [Oxalobacteraceae bacterium OM1]